MSKIKIKIGLSFWLFSFLCVYFGQSFLLVNYMLVLFIHEYSHAYIAYKLGYAIRDIRIIPFGISLNLQQDNLSPSDQIKIAIAGPLSNIVCVVFCLAIWWLFPAIYSYTYLFCFASLVTALFNFLPCFPMDGGRVLYGIIYLKATQQKSVSWCKIINIVVALCFATLFVVSCFVGINITFLLVAVFIFSCAFLKNNSNYDFLNYISKTHKQMVCNIKQLAISADLPVYKLCSYITNNNYINFVVIKEGKIQFSFFESELDKILLRYSPTKRVGEIKLCD